VRGGGHHFAQGQQAGSGADEWQKPLRRYSAAASGAKRKGQNASKPPDLWQNGCEKGENASKPADLWQNKVAGESFGRKDPERSDQVPSPREGVWGRGNV